MADEAGDYTLDPDELDEVIGRLEHCEGALERLTADLAKQMATLQETWEGLAADAQREAHEEWTQGMRAMRQALAELRAAARIAHGNYLGAAHANLTMWEQLR
jgi:WXG100 family type VII secretion target